MGALAPPEIFEKFQCYCTALPENYIWLIYIYAILSYIESIFKFYPQSLKNQNKYKLWLKNVV